MPEKNVGMLKPRKANVVAAWSNSEYCLSAERTPMGTATPSRLFDAIVSLQHGEPSRRAPVAVKKFDFAEVLQPLRGARVLLAEDNLVNQQVAMAFLTAAGLRVVVANNGVEAVDWVKKEQFALVLMDMQMPDMDGVEAARVIRGLPQGARLPIVAMTAAAMDEDKQACLAAGMNAHVSKPIDRGSWRRCCSHGPGRRPSGSTW